MNSLHRLSCGKYNFEISVQLYQINTNFVKLKLHYFNSKWRP